MDDLRDQLRLKLPGRVAVIGLGNEALGDDGLGVWLARELAVLGAPRVWVAGTNPERGLACLRYQVVDHVLFVDAADFGGAPGSVVLLSSGELAARFPQVSTHRLSLGLLARCLEADGGPRAWLLGVQPASLRPAPGLSPTLRLTLALLRAVLLEWLVVAERRRFRAIQQPLEASVLPAVGSPPANLAPARRL